MKQLLIRDREYTCFIHGYRYLISEYYNRKFSTFQEMQAKARLTGKLYDQICLNNFHFQQQVESLSREHERYLATIYCTRSVIVSFCAAQGILTWVRSRMLVH